jgi:NAD(P)-dependent dehydrogenase (short-subunit alcohol dehydrogenase family)
VNFFRGRTAIVTGAAHGIGRGIAELLEELGARVVAIDKNEPALKAAFPTGRYVLYHADLESDDVAALADEICAQAGPVQLLVNNVGVDTPGHFLEVEPADFDHAFDTNLRGPWFFTKRMIGHLLDDAGGGSVVFVSSLHDHAIRLRPHYSASKAAVAMLVKELAHELGSKGIRVNAVSPGVVRSASVGAPGPEEAARTSQIVPLGRMGEPIDVARVVAMLLNDEWSGYVTGANVPVDGGLGLHSWSVDAGAA